MATVITTQTLVDSTTRTVIKVVGVGGTDANVSLVTAANLAFAMTKNNNAILTPGDTGNAKSQYRTTIRRVFGQGQMTAGKYVMLQWKNDANSNIISFGDGSFDYNFASDGSVGSIGLPSVGNTTGDIIFSSTAASTDAWTLFIDLRKDNKDYSAGQFADPIAFNRGNAAL
jgi:hypothetical protein